MEPRRGNISSQMDDLPSLHSPRPFAALKSLLVLFNDANSCEVRPSIFSQHVLLLIIILEHLSGFQ